MKILFLVALSITLLVPAHAQSASATELADKKQGLTADGGIWGYKPATITDNSLPKVLLIGDSVCIGYRPEVIQQLQGKANVDAFVTPMHIGLAGQLYEQILAALSHGPYAVIHFNDMGLHAWQKGRIQDGQYEPLLRAYVGFLKTNAPNSALIWTSTTPITVKGQPTQLDTTNAVITERNAIAARVMTELNIPMDDLYQLMSDKLNLARGDSFHWTPQGQTLQGDQVAALIQTALSAVPTAAR